jgi:DNA-binding PadR family transcriptional regulator
MVGGRSDGAPLQGNIVLVGVFVARSAGSIFFHIRNGSRRSFGLAVRIISCYILRYSERGIVRMHLREDVFPHFFGRRRGFGGRGGGPFGFFGGFGGFGGGGPFGAGRKLGAPDLQLLILALLEEKPIHGYELIKELEERSAGFYSPSPGVIYPALTYLEELGFASVEASSTKKLYSITEEGRAHLQKHREEISSMMSELEHIAAKMARMHRFFERDESDDSFNLPHSDEFVDARDALKSAVRQKKHCSPKEAQRIAGILRRAAKEILEGGTGD